MRVKPSRSVREFDVMLKSESPVGLRLATTPTPVWDPGCRLTRCSLIGQTPDEDLVTWDGAPEDPGFSLQDLLPILEQHSLVAYDVQPVAAFCATKWRVMPAFMGDIVIAQRLLSQALTLGLLSATADHGLLYKQLLQVVREVDHQKLTLPYRLDLLVQSYLAVESARGYTAGESWVHPTWKVRDVGGRIVSAQPCISATKVADRVAYAATPLHRWVGMRWRDSEITVMAARSGDPFFLQLAREPAPYATLGTLWGVPEEDARKLMFGLIAAGPDAARRADKFVGPIGQELARVASRWQEWAEGVVNRAQQFGGIVTPLGVVVRADTHNAFSREVQETEAECLKMVLAQIFEDLDRRGDELTGFHACIPIYNRIFFQIDAHIPVERIVQYLQSTAALQPAEGIRFAVEVEVGSNWGTLTRVDNHAFAQTAADLNQPGVLPLRCPVCVNIAPDEPTLRDHLGSTHRVFVLSTVSGDESLLPHAIDQLIEQARQPFV